MRILQIHNRYQQAGGEDAVVRAEATLLRAGGHEVVEYHVQNPTGAVEASAAMALASWNPLTARAVRAQVERAQPDVAHVHNTWFTLSPSVHRALAAAGIPAVMTLHNFRLQCVNGLLLRDGQVCEDCVGTHPWRGVIHRCYRQSFASSAVGASTIALNRRLGTWDHVAIFLVMTEFGRERAVASGLPAERVVVKPHVVPDPGPRQAPPSTSTTVRFVGRLSEEKGLDTLLAAWAAAAPEGLQLELIGDGPMRPELERRRSEGVDLVGPLPPAEVTRRMLSARALVFPSVWYETFGLVVAEAAAAGLPVLASDLGGTPELVGGGTGGWLVKAGDASAWASALTILNDGRALDSAGLAGRRIYEARLSPAIGLSRLESIYTAARSLRGNATDPLQQRGTSPR